MISPLLTDILGRMHDAIDARNLYILSDLEDELCSVHNDELFLSHGLTMKDIQLISELTAAIYSLMQEAGYA